MKKDVGVCSQPGVVSFVDAIIVQDHMHFSICREFYHNLVHKLQEFNSSFKLCCLGVDCTGSNFQSSEEIQGSMPPVGSLESSNDLPVVRFHIPGGSFQRLHAWLLVPRYHKSLLWRIQVKTNDVRRLDGKLRISAHAPTSLAAQADSFFPQHPPYRMNRCAQMLCYCWSVPYRLSQWWRHLQCDQNLIAKLYGIFRRLPRTRKIHQTDDTFRIKPASPINHSIGTHLQFPGDLLERFSAKTSLDNLRSFNQSRFHRSALRPFFNQQTILLRALWNVITLGHNLFLLPRSIPCNY